MLTLIIAALGRRLAAHRERRQLRRLLQQDDRLLQDMGLRRADVESALRRPLGLGARHEAARLSRLSLDLDRAL